MNRSLAMLALFAAASLIQLGVPASMIMRRERTLKEGTVYKFKTRPVDPYDAFRGRYVALGFDQNTITNKGSHEFRSGQRAYAELTMDSEGFGRVARLTHDRPTEVDFVPVRVHWANAGEIRYGLPFDRYYLTEHLAPAAEVAYQKHSRREHHDAYVTVRVRAGYPVLEELYVGGVPILNYLEEEEVSSD